MTLEEAKSRKTEIKAAIMQHALISKRRFIGKSDWFYNAALSDLIPQGLPENTQGINITKFLKEYEIRDKMVRNLQRLKSKA
jgi:hypothetical protein